MLDRLAGNAELKQDLQAALRAGRLSHSVLLCGEAGCGAGFAARCLAADRLYPQGGPQAEAVLAGRAAECCEVRGEGASGEIKIDRVRRVRRQVFDTALSAEGRAVIFYGAHKLNGPSANALLKVLEEPPEGVLFVLTATGAAAVLPTIRSRCEGYTVAPVSAAECEAYLKKEFPACARPGLLARVYAGRIGLARAASRRPPEAWTRRWSWPALWAKKMSMSFWCGWRAMKRTSPPPSTFCGTLPAWRPPRWRGKRALACRPKRLPARRRCAARRCRIWPGT